MLSLTDKKTLNRGKFTMTYINPAFWQRPTAAAHSSTPVANVNVNRGNETPGVGTDLVAAHRSDAAMPGTPRVKADRWTATMDNRRAITDHTASLSSSYPGMVNWISTVLQQFGVPLSLEARDKIIDTVERYEAGKIGNAGAHKSEAKTFAMQTMHSCLRGDLNHAGIAAFGTFANTVGLSSAAISIQNYPQKASLESSAEAWGDQFATTLGNHIHIASNKSMNQKIG
jgi:hypothetical protein